MAAADYGGTESFEAYDRLLRGLSLHAQVTPVSLRQAAEQYRLALEIDPLYARAWAERAISLSALITPDLPDASALLSARDEASTRALELAPDMPLALVTKMWVHADRREWIPADEACAAVFAAPPDPRAQMICAGFLSVTGRVSRALPYRVAGRDADPLSMNTSQALSRQYAYLGRFEDFEREYDRVQELPGARWGLEAVRFIHLARRNDPRSLAGEVEAACALPDAPQYCPVIVRALRSPEEADALLRELLEAQRAAGGPGVGEIAFWAAGLGQTELALDALESFATTAGAAMLQTLWFEALADVRAHPRFKEIIRDIGYLDLWRTTGEWPDYCRPRGQEDFECF
jgi:tetratricopeptide (TPR) repeat protein